MREEGEGVGGGGRGLTKLSVLRCHPQTDSALRRTAKRAMSAFH